MEIALLFSVRTALAEKTCSYPSINMVPYNHP